MRTSEHTVQGHIKRPDHAVPRKYVEPILFLADQLAGMDRITPQPPTPMVDALAEATGLHDIRRQRWYRELNDDKACEMIDLETVKRGALVVLTLVMKSDTTRGEAAKAYFSKIRNLLGADPITVPSDIGEHKQLALRYLKS